MFLEYITIQMKHFKNGTNCLSKKLKKMKASTLELLTNHGGLTEDLDKKVCRIAFIRMFLFLLCQSRTPLNL